MAKEAKRAKAKFIKPQMCKLHAGRKYDDFETRAVESAVQNLKNGLPRKGGEQKKMSRVALVQL